MLDPEAQKLWEKYLSAEKDRIGYVTMSALDRFIEALLRHDQATWHAWACDLAVQVSDQRVDLPIRLPLFRRVLLPALSDGVLEGVSGCARALAYFEPLLLKSDEVSLPDPLRSAVGLLRAAVRSDPADQLARKRLVKRWESYLEETLHELPDGVLCRHGWATPEECEELLDLLQEFRSHVAVLGLEEQFADLLADCDLHFNSYREYLTHGQSHESYERFLEARPG